MKRREVWAQRVTEWKASGLSSRAFCDGKDFSQGGLRYWAHRIAHESESKVPELRVARVRRVRKAKEDGEFGPAAVVLVVGPARVEVRSGFDAATLAGVVEVLVASMRGS
jgi:hypothetical protein